MENNLKRIEELKTFMGGDNNDVPIPENVIDDMKLIVELCHLYSIPQPDICPHAGGGGAQAEWEYNWYIEIDSDTTNGVSALLVKDFDYENAIECNFSDIKHAFLLVKEFINHIVHLDGSRK